MGLVISVSITVALSMSKLNNQISGICEVVESNDGHLLFIPHAGKLMALVEILNEEGIAYHIQRSKQKEEL